MCSFVRDSEHLINKLKDIKLSEDDTLASFNVVSLFTSVSVKETLNIIKNHVGIDELYLEALELCLSSTYFLFDGQIYEQSEGTAMGSPLSLIIAQIFMVELEKKFLNSAVFKPMLWLRYVDDCLLIWDHGEDKLHKFLSFTTLNIAT
jgi:hypothetical protein